MSNDAAVSFQVVAITKGGAIALVSTTKNDISAFAGNKDDYQRNWCSGAAPARTDTGSEVAIYNPSAIRVTA